MRKINFSIFLFILVFIYACNSDKQHPDENTVVERAEGECPKGHTDEVIEIIYGMPSQDLFQQADSGLVMLGGCEVSDDSPNYYCKKHGISF